MSETRFNLRRPDPEPAADVESYIEGGQARAGKRREDAAAGRAVAGQHAPPLQAAGRGAGHEHVRPLPRLGGRGACQPF